MSNPLDGMRVTVLGCGTMGEALLAGMLRSKVLTPDRARASVRKPQRAKALADRHGCATFTDNFEAVADADMVIVGVKPQGAANVLPPLAEALSGKLVVSVCAGVQLRRFYQWLPTSRCIRAMPNTPSRIGKGMTVLSPGAGASEEDLAAAEAAFSAVGRCRVLDEKHMDAVTGLSGSGPAFACVVLEALADGGVMMGLPRDAAVELAAQMLAGAAELVLEQGEHPAALKDEVTTPAGCTIAGLLMLEDGGIRSTLARAIQEASKVAGELG